MLLLGKTREPDGNAEGCCCCIMASLARLRAAIRSIVAGFSACGEGTTGEGTGSAFTLDEEEAGGAFDEDEPFRGGPVFIFNSVADFFLAFGV